MIAEITSDSSWEQKRYRHCLKIVELITFQKGEDAADLFIDKFLHTNLIKNIRVRFKGFFIFIVFNVTIQKDK